MDVKRILSIFHRDVVNNRREFMLLYIILAPLLIAFGLRFFIPSVNAISLQFAVDEHLEQRVIQELERYGRVECFDRRDRMEKRIHQIDDIIGITQEENGEFVIIREGNETGQSQWVASQIIDKVNGGTSNVDFEYSDIGTKLSAVSIYGTSSVILMAIVMAGMVIGLNMIDEKESRTISALTVTPMSKTEFIVGKSLIGVLLPVVETLLALWLLGMTNLNFGMIVVMTVVSSLVTIIFGFLIGVLSPNQIAGIANMKFLLVFLSASVIGAMVLPAQQQFLLYWSPIYWSFIGLSDIITNTATWGAIGMYSLWISVLTVVVFLIFRGRINQGLMEAE